MSSSGCSHGNTPGLGVDNSTDDDDDTQPPDDNDGGIGDATLLQQKSHKDRERLRGHLAHLQGKMPSHMLHKTMIMESSQKFFIDERVVVINN